MRKARHLIKSPVQPFTQETRLSQFQYLIFTVLWLLLPHSLSYFLGQPGSRAMDCTYHESSYGRKVRCYAVIQPRRYSSTRLDIVLILPAFAVFAITAGDPQGYLRGSTRMRRCMTSTVGLLASATSEPESRFCHETDDHRTRTI